MDRAEALERLRAVRALSEAMVAPLSPEDAQLQCMPEASPAKWHLAHTTWFFETFVLGPLQPGFAPHDPAWAYLFNSYYEACGARHPRERRGLLSRPSLAEVLDWRQATDTALARFIEAAPAEAWAEAAPRLELGLHHEQQHQELLASDIKANLATQPLRPAWIERALEPGVASPLGWVGFPGGRVAIGAEGPGFAFDHERPRHELLMRPFELSDRLVTNAEVAAFIEAGGYQEARLWLADGWAWVQAEGIEAPAYWHREAPEAPWREATLHGDGPLDPARPVAHLSGYEAEAIATWLGARLPTEAELEVATADLPLPEGGLDPARPVHPAAAPPAASGTLRQGLGVLWAWTRSAFLPYPGFEPLPGALGEYNGKFMSGQWVLRGGCVATPPGHLRRAYRNFYYPHQRWMFSGLRLARDLKGAP